MALHDQLESVVLRRIVASSHHDAGSMAEFVSREIQDRGWHLSDIVDGDAGIGQAFDQGRGQGIA